jgi:hypothetical protein
MYDTLYIHNKCYMFVILHTLPYTQHCEVTSATPILGAIAKAWPYSPSEGDCCV